MASWNVDQLYGAYKFLARKNNAGGISATDFFYAWNMEQAMYHQDVVGRWQRAANGKQGANTGIITNQTVLRELTPFIITSSLTPIVTGSITKPTDIISITSMRDPASGKKITGVRHDQLPAALKSVIDPPSDTAGSEQYYYTEDATKFNFYPITLGTATLTYVAAPADVVWDYTLDGNGRQVYNSGGATVQSKWSQNTNIEITKRALINIGISFKDIDFINYGKQAQISGD